MSWLTDIAGKAEDFLNKIDQNAAVALSNVNENIKGKHSPRRSKPRSQYDLKGEESHSLPHHNLNLEQKQERLSVQEAVTKFSALQTSNSHVPPSPTLTGGGGSSAADKLGERNRQKHLSKNLSVRSADVKPAATDEQLLDFLNSSDEKGLDEAAILKKELMSQVNDMKVFVKNHKQLQKEHEALQKLYEETKAKFKLSPQNNSEGQTGEVGNFQELEMSLIEKNEEIHRLTQRLDSALSKLQTENQSQIVQNRLEQVELKNKRLKEAHEETTQKYNEVMGQLELMNKQAQSVRESFEANQKEYAVYKNKAKSILKSKDELIVGLEKRQRSRSPSDMSSTVESSSFSQDSHFFAEINTLRNERELFQAELSQSITQIDGLKEENNRLENELLSFRSINFDLQNILTKERQRVRVAQEENLQLSQTISSLQLDLEREMLEKKKMQEKHRRTPSNSLTRNSSLSDFQLQPPSSTRQSPLPFSEFHPEETDQLRTRITALSQSLLEKQSLINELSSDKQLLQIKIERLESHLQDLRDSSNFGNDGICTQSVVSSQPLYLSESPWDTSVALRMKRVYSQVDSLCCQFGLVMRQRPTVRLIFSAYVLLLHIWVFFVLFFWSHNYITPDSHKK